MASSAARSLRAWRLVFGAALVATLVMSLMPSDAESSFVHQDKIQHALGFAALGWLGLRAGARSGVALWLGLVAFGILIEAAQGLTPTRQPEWGDLVADALGAGLVIAVVHGRWRADR